MNPDPKPAATDTLDAVAAAWLARRDRRLTSQEQDQYLQWLRQDARHGQAIARLEKAWGALDALSEWRPTHSTQPNPDLLAAPARRKYGRYVAATLAAAAAIALSFVLWRSEAPEPAAPLVARQYARQTLPDGSVVELNRDAAIQVQFTPAERRIELVRGEANFTVTKNPARPFVVHVGKIAVHAVGTVFNVSLKSGTVEVIVTEGKVRVEEPAAPARQLLSAPLLVAGQRAVISTSDSSVQAVVAQVTPEEISRTLAWQPARLEFNDTALVDVVAEFNRHNRHQLVIADPELSTLRVGGNFRADNVDTFVRLLEAGFGVQAEQSGDQTLLRKAR